MKKISLLITVFLLAVWFHAFGQEHSARDQIKFIQSLAWYPDDFAYRYEVTIEKENKPGQFTVILKEFTENDHIEVSLPSGAYRYHVLAYDFMDNPAGNPEWLYFNILAALDPELSGFTPEIFYFNDTSDLILHVIGHNLEPDAKLWLQPRMEMQKTETASETKESTGDIFPQSFRFNASGDEIEIHFKAEKLKYGDYDIFIQNPGGLSASIGTFKIVSFKTAYSISAGYAPMIPLYGVFKKLLDSPVYPAGAIAHFTVFPFKGKFNPIGIEAVPYWNYLSSTQYAYPYTYNVSGHMINFTAYFLIQKTFLNKVMAVNFRLGGGFLSMINFKRQHEDFSVDLKDSFFPSASGGVSFLWFFHTPFFAEAGFEYTHFFSNDDISPGHLLPFIGLGIKF
jgi:hypothetical protein